MRSVTKEEHGTEAIRQALESAGDRFLMVWDSKDHPTAGKQYEDVKFDRIDDDDLIHLTSPYLVEPIPLKRIREVQVF